MGARARAWRWPRLVAVVAAACLALTGCVDLSIESDYSAGTSAKHALQVTIDKDALQQLSQLGGESGGDTDILTNQDETRQQAEARGYEYAAIDNDQQQGSRISKTFDDPAQAGASLNAIFTDLSEDPNAAPMDGFAGGLNKDGDTYTFALSVNSDKVFADSSGDSSDSGDDTTNIPASALGDAITFTYTATLPGKVKETNGTVLPDGRVQWKLPLSGTTQLTATTTAGGSGGNGTLYIIIGIIVVVALLAAGAFFALRHRRVAATPAVPAVPPAPSAPSAEAD